MAQTQICNRCGGGGRYTVWDAVKRRYVFVTCDSCNGTGRAS